MGRPILFAAVLLAVTPLAAAEEPVLLPFHLDSTYQYVHIVDGRPVGTNSFAISRLEDGYRVNIETVFDGRFGRFRRKSVLITDLRFRPLRYELEVKGKTGFTRERFTVKEGVARIFREVSGRALPEKVVQTGGDAFLWQIYCTPLWALIVSELRIQPGETAKVRGFQPAVGLVQKVSVRLNEWEEIEFDGRKVKARKISAGLGCRSFALFVDRWGRVLRHDEGRRRVHLADTSAVEVAVLTSPEASFEKRCRAEDMLGDLPADRVLPTLLEHVSKEPPGTDRWVHDMGRERDREIPVRWQIRHAIDRAWNHQMTAAGPELGRILVGLFEERKRNPDNMLGAYFLALKLGDCVGVDFKPDQHLPEYQGEHGLTESFFGDTVKNALAWWQKNRPR